MAPARTPDVGAFMDNLGALRAMLGPSVASRMQAHGEDQEARWDAGERGPTPLTEDRVWLADDVAGALLGPIGMAGVIKAYHGSPHRFDRFDMSKIGTGEGAQAYGHGLYFAEGEDTARTYQKALANIAHPDRGPEWVAKQWLSENGGDVATAEAALRESITSWKSNPIANNDPQLREMIANMESAIPLLGRVTPEPGALYTTRLNVEPDDLLDWDKPLSEQSAKVRAAVAGRIEQLRKVAPDYVPDDPDGAWIYKAMGPQGGVDEIDFSRASPFAGAASDRLREAGIPGIRYLDQGSRASGDGTRNFVIFDDSLISIENVD